MSREIVIRMDCYDIYIDDNVVVIDTVLYYNQYHRKGGFRPSEDMIVDRIIVHRDGDLTQLIEARHRHILGYLKTVLDN